jgi:hypothetical protein
MMDQKDEHIHHQPALERGTRLWDIKAAVVAAEVLIEAAFFHPEDQTVGSTREEWSEIRNLQPL